MKKTEMTASLQPNIPLLDFLAHCSRTANVCGDWVSAKDAKARNVDPSADIAYAAATSGETVGPDDWKAAAKALELFEARVGSERSTQFDRDLRIQMIASHRMVHSKNYRMFAAIMGIYQRAQKQAAITATQLPSFYMGKIGERITLTAEVTHVSAYQGKYASQIVNFLTVDGARLTWFSNDNGWEPGSTYTFKATIKAHRDYRGQPQTIINRCAVVSEPALVA